MKAKIETTLIASAKSEPELLKMVQGYFYSGNIFFANDGEVHNSTGQLKNFRVNMKAKRWRFERVHENQL